MLWLKRFQRSFFLKVFIPSSEVIPNITIIEEVNMFFTNRRRKSIPAIWDVIWGQTNLFSILDWPLNTLSRKYRLSKKWILSYFWPSHKAVYSTSTVLSKQSHSQVKNLEIFFRKFDLSEFWSNLYDYYIKKYLC